MSDEASTGPAVVYREAQPYVGVRASVTMTALAEVAHRIPELLAWVGARGQSPAGPPFFRYLVIDMNAKLEVEVGVPVTAALADDGDVRGGALPAGRYATVTHVGAPNTLVEATRSLLDWAAEQGLNWDMVAEGSEERWGCRIESYLTDPRLEPDTKKWQTELGFRLAD
jgi:effector-binding domain-containing protein